jgi:hypothetical protein
MPRNSDYTTLQLIRSKRSCRVADVIIDLQDKPIACKHRSKVEPLQWRPARQCHTPNDLNPPEGVVPISGDLPSPF